MALFKCDVTKERVIHRAVDTRHTGSGPAAKPQITARESYKLVVDQSLSIDITIGRVSIFREECRCMARPYQRMDADHE